MLVIRMRILLFLGFWHEFGLGLVHKACLVIYSAEQGILS
jgi:hypothetical protein